MRIEVVLPELGEDGGDEATVSFWYVDVGESVGEGDDLVEMVTDKATFNVPSPATGTLVEIVSDEEAKVHVGDVIGVMSTDDGGN